MATFEMMWDCPTCDSKKLLGKSHRHCPNCGAAQDPNWRYFPAEDEKVAVEEHQFVGVDWECMACDTPNAKAAEFCTNCGAGHDGKAKSVAVLEDSEVGGEPEKAAVDTPPEDGGGGGCAYLMGCIPMIMVAGLVGVVGVFLFFCIGSLWTSETTLTVTGHAWTRTVEIETLRERSKSEWCDEMPKGATDIRRSEKEKSTKKVADGQTCKKINVDNGDGTMKQKQKCTPKYKKVPVMAPWCSFKAQEWVKRDTVKALGGLTDKRKWPVFKVDGCKEVGCTRAGEKKELYTVTLVDADKVKQTCDFMEMKWKGMTPGSHWTGAKSVLTGSVACGDLVRR